MLRWIFFVALQDVSGDIFKCASVSSHSSLQIVGQDHSDLVADLLKELSNHNERAEERKGALVELLKITREDSLAVWDEHFKTILLLLLETLGDKDVRSLGALTCFCAVCPLGLCGAHAVC